MTGCARYAAQEKKIFRNYKVQSGVIDYMVKREEAVASIGFDGNAALVDKSMKKKYSAMNTADLAGAGFFRAATISALYSDDPSELDLVADSYNRLSGSSYAAEAMPRLFGVARVSVQKAVVL